MGSVAAAISDSRGGNASMRIGTVTGYDGTAGAVTVDVGGGTLVSCPYLGSYIPSVGDHIVMLSAGATWVVLGSVGTTTPPLTPQTAVLDPGVQSTTSTSYTDLTTVGPSITATVAASGRALVLLSCRIGWFDTTTDPSDGGAMSCAVSGASTVAADDQGAAYLFAQYTGTTGASVTAQIAGVRFLTGLTPGRNVFTAKYKSADPGAKSVDFSKRSLTVIVL